jgi:hypothetical protein
LGVGENEVAIVEAPNASYGSSLIGWSADWLEQKLKLSIEFTSFEQHKSTTLFLLVRTPSNLPGS